MSVRIHLTVGAIAIATITSLGVSATAQQSQASKWCNASEADGVSLDLQISGCTTTIQSGKLTTKNLAVTFYNRGIAYKDKGQYDRAIQDYNQAIRLNPQYAEAFNNRGFSYLNKGQYDRAIQDYDQAIRLNPNLTAAIKNRVVAIAKKKP